MYGVWCFKPFLPFLLYIEGGKNKAKIAQINISRYILMYANSDVHQLSREQDFFLIMVSTKK